jgi:hypothetical protein
MHEKRVARGYMTELMLALVVYISMAAAITLAATFTYGFLETAGFPKVSMFWVWIGMGASTAAVSLARKWTGR